MNIIGEAINELPEVMQMTKAEDVAKYIPPGAEYVTVASTCPVTDVKALKRSSHFSFDGVTLLQALGPKSVGYLFHDNANLYFKTSTATVFQMALNQISNVEPLNGDHGKLIITSANGTYLVGQFVAVQIAPGTTYKTWSGASFGDYAWHKELARLGVVTQSQQNSIKHSRVIFGIIWSVGLVIVLGLVFIKFIKK